LLEDVTKQIFGYLPRSWQTKVTEKVLEGHDVIVITGTGARKSLIFAMLAIDAELASFEGIVVVICPLKSLQKDQVGSFSQM
jgi:superfamily II DNA helicase RecQ